MYGFAPAGRSVSLTAVPGRAPNVGRMRTRVLWFLLLARSAVHALFAVRLFRSQDLDWAGIFQLAANYALADAALAVILFVVLLGAKAETSMAIVIRTTALCDGVVRVAAAGAILTLPGIPYFVLTKVLFLGALGADVAVLGLLAVAVTIREAKSRIHSWPLDSWWARAAFGAGGAAALVTGLVLFVYPPALAAELRTVGVYIAASFSVIFALAGAPVVFARRDRSRHVASGIPVHGRT